MTAGRLFFENRNHAAATAHHVAVAHRRKNRVLPAGVRVAVGEELLGAELRRPVQIDRIGSLVGRKRHDLRDTRLNRSLHDVFGTNDVGADTFEGIIRISVSLTLKLNIRGWINHSSSGGLQT